MKAYEYIISLKDRATSTLRRVAQTAGITDSKIRGVDSATRSANGSSSRWAGTLGSLKTMIVGAGIAFAAWGAIKTVAQKGVELEQLKVKFEVLTGSVENATKLYNELTAYANFTPYSNDSINKGAEMMLGFGIAQEEIMSNMKMLGDIAMGSETRLSGLSLVFSQIKSTGRLMGQDLLQLINQGFNPLTVISDQTGISMLELKKHMEKGAISADMVTEAMRLATSEGGRYNKMADKMAETAGGKWSTLMGKLSYTAGIVGEKLINWLTPLIDIGIAVVDNILPFVTYLGSMVQWISQATPLLVFMGGVILALGVNYALATGSMLLFNIQFYAYVAAVKIATAATAIFNFVMAMNPISLVIIGIAALIAIVMVMWNKFDWFRGSIMGVWEVLKGLGETIKTYVIERFKELISGITGLGSALLAFIKGDFSKAMELGKKASQDLMGKDTAKKAFENGKLAFAEFGKGYNKGVAMVGDTEIVPTVKEPKMPVFAKPQTTVFDSLLDPDKDKDKDKNKDKSKGDSIVSGGNKMTNITVHIGKLQDKVEIHVSNAKEGVRQLGDKVQEELLRAVNSVNQMQTN
jgi:tape measure domain-containing protein